MNESERNNDFACGKGVKYLEFGGPEHCSKSLVVADHQCVGIPVNIGCFQPRSSLLYRRNPSSLASTLTCRIFETKDLEMIGPLPAWTISTMRGSPMSHIWEHILENKVVSFPVSIGDACGFQGH